MLAASAGKHPMAEDHWLPGFNFNVERWDAKGQTYEPQVAQAMRVPLALAQNRIFCRD